MAQVSTSEHVEHLTEGVDRAHETQLITGDAHDKATERTVLVSVGWKRNMDTTFDSTKRSTQSMVFN